MGRVEGRISLRGAAMSCDLLADGRQVICEDIRHHIQDVCLLAGCELESLYGCVHVRSARISVESSIESRAILKYLILNLVTRYEYLSNLPGTKFSDQVRDLHVRLFLEYGRTKFSTRCARH